MCMACTSPCCNGGLWPAKLHHLALYWHASPHPQARIHMVSPLLCLQCLFEPCTLLAVAQLFAEWTIAPSQIYLLKLKKEIKLCTTETPDYSLNGLGCFYRPGSEAWLQVEMRRWSDNQICPVQIPGQSSSQQSLKALMDADAFITQNKEGGWEEAHRPSVAPLKPCLVSCLQSRVSLHRVPASTSPTAFILCLNSFHGTVTEVTFLYSIHLLNVKGWESGICTDVFVSKRYVCHRLNLLWLKSCPHRMAYTQSQN